MTVSIRVTHPSGKIDPAKYWLGFLVVHEEYSETGMVYAVDSIEIVSLNLSFVEHRRVSGGFSFPMALRNDEKNRTDPSTVAAYYIQIEDLATAFDPFRSVKYVEFAVLQRDGGRLQSLGSGAVVHFHTDRGVVSCAIGDAEGRHACIHRTFARRDEDGRWTLAIGDSWLVQPNSRGEIREFCANVRDELEQQRRALSKLASPASANEAIPLQEQQNGSAPLKSIALPTDGNSDLGVDLQEVEGTNSLRSPVDQARGKKPTPAKPDGDSGQNWQKIAAVLSVLLGVVWYLVHRAPSAITSTVADGTDQARTTTSPPPPVPAPTPAPPVVSRPAPLPQIRVPVVPSPTPMPLEPRYPVRTREEVTKFGFDDHLKKVVQVLKATGARDEATYVDGMTWLEANKQPPLLDPDGAVTRKAFNDETERRIVAARNTTDQMARNELTKVAGDSTEFLMHNFGSARAQLNLALTYILLNQPKASLPPAFHSIVYNPIGGNEWVALGMGLALQGDHDGGTQGLCIALKVARFSDRTVSLMKRLEAGQEYDYPLIRQSAHNTRSVCPSNNWN